MSNALAIPTVTAALTSIVQSAIDPLQLTPGPVATAGPLDDSGETPRVGIHLYRVSRNAARSTDDLPTRSSNGDLRSQPRAALDLHYLFTFRGNDEWETQQMLGATAAALQAEPELLAARLTAAATAQAAISGNDLAAAEEPVRVTPDTVSLDELTRFWALYPPASFAVSLAAVAGPVVIDGAGLPGTLLPVAGVGLGAAPLAPIRLDRVTGPGGPRSPVRASAPMPDLDVFGARLAAGEGETVDVLVDGHPVAHTTVDATHLVLPAAPLAPGQHLVQARRRGPPVDSALSPTPTEVESDVVAILVVPALGPVAVAAGPGSAPGLRTGTVTVDVTPSVSPDQQVRLVLDSLGLSPPVAVTLEPDWPQNAPPPFGSAEFPFEDVRAGQYRVTIEVDEARSIPALDATGHYVLTVVTL